MENNHIVGAGEMPIHENENAAGQNEAGNDSASRQPDFRVVQPEFSVSDNKTIFKDVGALWHNVSQKTGREFYTLKIGKLRLLVFPNQKLVQTE